MQIAEDSVTTLIADLYASATTALQRCYSGESLPYAIRIGSESRSRVDGRESLRYALIAAIGMGKDETMSELRDLLWSKARLRLSGTLGLGDLGLGLWAAVSTGDQEVARRLAAEVCAVIARDQHEGVPSSELSWAVIGMCEAHRQVADAAHDGAVVLHSELMRRYNQTTGLFHTIVSRIRTVRSCVASFADQVYPILALSTFGRVFDSSESLYVAVAVADVICGLQGRLGQWWWHYDVYGGRVSEEYPVFSVHQDSMAPMVLMDVDAVAGSDHWSHVVRGLEWLAGRNELGVGMIHPDEMVVYRSFERGNGNKLARVTRAMIVAAGLGRANKALSSTQVKLRINYEHRPYHSGWILYAWANRLGGRT